MEDIRDVKNNREDKIIAACFRMFHNSNGALLQGTVLETVKCLSMDENVLKQKLLCKESILF